MPNFINDPRGVARWRRTREGDLWRVTVTFHADGTDGLARSASPFEVTGSMLYYQGEFATLGAGTYTLGLWDQWNCELLHDQLGDNTGTAQTDETPNGVPYATLTGIGATTTTKPVRSDGPLYFQFEGPTDHQGVFEFVYRDGPPLRAETYVWKSDSSGDWSDRIEGTRGTIEKIVTIPDFGNTPSNNYDIVITDEMSQDLAAGLLADRDRNDAEWVYPYRAIDATTAAATHVVTDFDVTISNAGNSNGGSVVIVFDQ